MDGRELVQELKNFPDLPSKSMTLLELLTFIHDKELAEIYPNLWTALRIGLACGMSSGHPKGCEKKTAVKNAAFILSTVCISL